MTEEVAFSSRDKFRQWLEKNHSTSKGIWLVFSKVNALKTLKPGEALEEALCFGWIDGQIKSLGDEKYLKKFTPRAKGSKWSAANRDLARQLGEHGTMTEHGIRAMEEAKKRGHWEVPKRDPVPDDRIEILIKALQGADLALANFQKMPASVRRTYTGFYLDAKKEETRIRRLEYIIQRLNANKGPM